MNFSLNPNPRFGRHLDKILFLVACSYLLGVLGWLIGQNKLNSFAFPFLQQRVTEETQISAADAQFIAYLQRSLQEIDQQSPTNPTQEATTPSTQLGAKMASLKPEPNEPAKELPTISVPLNQKKTEFSTPLATAVPLPVPLPPPPVLSVPKPIRLSPVVRPNLASAPKAKVAVPSSQARLSAETTPTPIPTATVSQTLVGLLELGDNSAALFNLGGITQKIQLGEEIGSSGWRLLAIADERAVVHRNGEVRSLQVGERL